MFKRVVIKLSGEALAGNSQKNFDDSVIEQIYSQIRNITQNGTQVSLVVGGGNFWRGRSANSEMDKSKADQIGMLATVINALYLSEFFNRKGLTTKIFTPFTVGTMTKLFSKESVIENLESGCVVIFAGGTGHPFFSTDTVTALRAAEIEADCILYAKNIDGIYTADPKKNPEAKKYKFITYNKIISDDLQAIDAAAMHISISANIPSVVFALAEKNSIEIACSNDYNIYKIGTKIDCDIQEEFYE